MNKKDLRIHPPKDNNKITSDKEDYSPVTSSPFASESNFSFSPNKKNPKQEGLAHMLTDRPQPAKSRILKKTLTSLYDRAKDISLQKEKKVKAIFNEYHPFRPKLNTQSMKMVKLAKKEGKDLHHSKKVETINPQPSPDEFLQPKKKVSLKGFIERNYKVPLERIESRKVPQFVELLDRVDETCTFQPSLDKKSREMTSSNKVDIYSKSVRMIEEKKMLIENQKRNNEMEVMKNCTFTPKIIKDLNLMQKSDSRNYSQPRTYSGRMKSFDTSPFRLSVVECIDEFN